MDHSRIVNRVVVGVAVTLLAAAAHADTIYVDDDNCPGPGNGTEGDPFCSIQAGIDVAVYGDEVLVAPGTYFESIDFIGKAITLRSSDGPAATTIDAQAAGSVVTCALSEGPDTVLEGFTITNGSATNGGGMFILQAGPTLLNCTLRENIADYGGGVFNNSGTPALVDCTLGHNTAYSSGGGMYNFGHPGQPGARLTNCQFNENIAQNNGGAVRNWDSSPTLIGCTFYYNHVRFNGAGMANGGASHPVITGCLFLSNRTDTLFANWDSYGGGMHNSEDARPVLINCIFQANSAHALYPWLSHGGAIANLGDAGPQIINCTLIANHANLGDGLFNGNTAVGAIANSILWDSEDEIVNEDAGWADIRYSDVRGSWPGPGNISADPLFQDLMLLPGSPCIDAGDNTAVPAGITTDLGGSPRFVDDPDIEDTGIGDPPIVDMGAYEFQTGCPWDCGTPADGQVNVVDFLALLGQWGTSGTCDVNGGGVNVTDFLEVIGNWGPCPD